MNYNRFKAWSVGERGKTTLPQSIEAQAFIIDRSMNIRSIAGGRTRMHNPYEFVLTKSEYQRFRSRDGRSLNSIAE